MYNYIHIPFCRQKCLYCKFALTPRWQQIQIRKYLKFLEKEIRESFVTNQKELTESVYFGGGTPSVLSVEQISHIIGTFREYSDFSRDTEMTLEANPEDITKEFVRGIREAGVNRLSLGVQTLNLNSLQIIGRSSELFALKALDILERECFPNVNVDFILGLPGVVSGETEKDIKQLLDRYSCIKHVSVYMLENENYPVSWKEKSLPQEAYEKDFLAIGDTLVSREFSHYELSNFARPGYESRHNQAYWTHKNYRGFGLSAASYIDGQRFTRSTSFLGYYRGDFADSEILTDEQVKLEEIMFRFRTFRGIPKGDFAHPEKLVSFLSDGYLREEGGQVFLNSSGIFILDYIMGELI